MNNLNSVLNTYFYNLEKNHGIKLTEGQKSWYSAKYVALGDLIKREYPSTPLEPFEVASDAYFFQKYLIQARNEGRITRVPHNYQSLVYAAWDKGITTCIWLYQFIPGGSIHVIDSLKDTGSGVYNIASKIKEKPYAVERNRDAIP